MSVRRTVDLRLMKTKKAIDPSLPWVEHYVEYGFAVREGLLDREFVEDALAAAVELIGAGLPLDEWTVDNVKPLIERVQLPTRGPEGALLDPSCPQAILSRIYDQPRLRRAIGELFGPRFPLNDDRYFLLMVKPRDPRAAPGLLPSGHIDFSRNAPIPILGSGTMFQVSLVDKEPGGGNLTVWPGTHQDVMRHVVADPDWRYPKDWADIPEDEPFEFVGEAGDVIFFHHLVAHNGNPCTTRMPRISLHCHALVDEWLTEIDPAAPNLSPWERSLACGGAFHIRKDEAAMREKYLKRHAPA